MLAGSDSAASAAEFAFTPGGVWRPTMHGPDGRDYENRVLYEEIVQPSRIVYTHEGDAGSVCFHSTITSNADRDLVADKYGAVEAARQTLQRLAESLTPNGAKERGAP